MESTVRVPTFTGYAPANLYDNGAKPGVYRHYTEIKSTAVKLGRHERPEPSGSTNPVEVLDVTLLKYNDQIYGPIDFREPSDQDIEEELKIDKFYKLKEELGDDFDRVYGTIKDIMLKG